VGVVWHVGQPDTWAPLLLKASLAFVAFCAVASAGYLVNDVRDIESDRLHPRKRTRPIAAGQLSPATAQAAAVVLGVVGLLLGIALGWKFLTILAVYVALTLSYSYLLKRLVILDVLAIAVGFVLRAIAGAFAIAVVISPWLYLCTILGALFLAVNKRRHELLLLGDAAQDHRRSLAGYSVQLLDQMSATATACTVIAYSLYTFTAENLPRNHVMMATIPFVLYGIFRYLYLVYERGEGGNPDEMIVRDAPLLACVGLFLLTSVVLLAIYR
jgi:4-hydroxybenzoate polyprenyltransferase